MLIKIAKNCLWTYIYINFINI